MTNTTWAGIVQGRVDDARTNGPAVKEVPSSPKPDAPENDDFTIKAFNTEHKDTHHEQTPVDNISSTLERKESLPKASQSLTPSPRTSRNGSPVKATGKAGSVAVPAHQRLYEYGLALRQKKEEAAAKQNSDLTFKPELSPRSRNVGPSNPPSSGGARAPVYERLSSAANETQKRLEKLRQERLETERRACTFTPKVNNYSEKLLSQRTSNLGANNPQARQQAYLKKMNQTFGGCMMRKSGYGTQGVAQANSASIGGSIRSRQLQQLAQRKSLVGCDATPAMLAAAGPEFTEKMKKELRAAYGIKLREESPLEEVERWYKASLQEEAEIEQAAQQAREAALAASLREVEEWWKAACEETEAAAAADVVVVDQPVGDLISLEDDDLSVKAADHAKSAAEIVTEAITLDNKAQITEGSDQIAAEIADPEESKVTDSDKTAVLTLEAAAELQEEKLDQMNQLLDAKEEELVKEITQLDTALLEVKVLPSPALSSPVTTVPEEDKEQESIAEEETVPETFFTEAEVVLESDAEVSRKEPTEQAPAAKALPTTKKAAIKYHASRINAALSLQGSKAGSAIKIHSAKISKALKKSSSSGSKKILHHTSAMAAAIQKNGAKIAELISHHSARITLLKKDTHAAAAANENGAAFRARIQQITSNMTTTVQQINISTAGTKQKVAAVSAAISATAEKIAAAVREYAALTAATLGKHGNSIVAALQQLAARIVAALKSTANSIAAAMKRYQSSIAKAGRKLPRSRGVQVIA